jgi:transcriptional regulator with XRE-family HTH domain
MYYQKTMDFSEWVVVELDERGWSRSEAARRGGISPSMFDKVINGQAKPGLEMVKRYLSIVQSDIDNVHRRASPVDNWAL